MNDITYNNKKNSNVIRLIYCLIIVLNIIVFGCILFKFSMLPLGTKYLVVPIAICVAWVMLFFYLEPCYVCLTVEAGSCKLQYYSITSLFKRDYKYIECNLAQLNEAAIVTAFWGLKKELTIVVNTQRGEAIYPSINISACTKAQLAIIKEVLTDGNGNA